MKKEDILELFELYWRETAMAFKWELSDFKREFKRL